jgi:SAM-dependent methyltransferase
VISPGLLERVACPVCLEPAGCGSCRREPGHASCAAYRERVRCPCGGPDKARLETEADALACPCCKARYAVRGAYLDLLPRAALGSLTQYADHDFHDHISAHDGPPLLSARVKADMMRRMLDPSPEEALLDLGCGGGKLALYARARGARAAGVDVSPFFLPSAEREVDLAQGDLRRLPFRKGAFARAYTLDVLEHLDEEGVREVLLEARRTIGPWGRLFVYTHAMESSWLARFQRGVNRLARRLGRAGLLDHEREALRKSDHVNAIRSHEHFDLLCAGAGLEVVERRYYNVVLKAVVEDLLLRLLQQARRRRRPAEAGSRPAEQRERAVHVHVAPPPGRAVLALGLALSWLLKLDVVLFGGLRTGPFFGLLRPRPAAGAQPLPAGPAPAARPPEARAS